MDHKVIPCQIAIFLWSHVYGKIYERMQFLEPLGPSLDIN